MAVFPKSICVFCGSKQGGDPNFTAMAQTFAQKLAAQDRRLIYGGGSIGLMGVIADEVKHHGGHVTGVIPEFLNDFEVGHAGLDELILTPDMHSRKETMFKLADGFVILPGGLGTLDETFEILTWKQLQLHQKPIVLLNANGFWDPIWQMIERIIEQGFAHEKVRDLLQVADSVEAVFDCLDRPQSSDTIVLTSHF